MVIKIILAIIVLYFVSVVLLYFFQERFIFLNDKLDNDFKFTFEVPFEEINLKTTDGKNINSLLFKVDNPKGVILYFHGNKGNLERWGKVTEEFTKYNYDIFVMDYRNYGKSTGDFDEHLMYDDAIMCFDYLKKNYDNIVVYGRSLGGTFATKVASVRDANQLILEAPFYNLMDVVVYHYPLLTTNYLLKYKFNSNKYIGDVKCKTTIFHGDQDRVVPFKSSKKLYKISNKGNTTHVEIKKGTHHNLAQFDEYKNKMAELLR